MTAHEPPRLAIFDIDGTLTRTSAVDDACYRRAVLEEWGIADVSTDWGSYAHSTDNAIASEIHRRHRGRDATTAELASLRDRFVRLVQAAPDDAFQPTPGAAPLLDALAAAGWSVAIASGGWRPSAEHKLERAGRLGRGLPGAFGCDAWPRDAIVRIAAHRALAARGTATWAKIVYVGDGVWDVRACRTGGFSFVGVGEGRRADALRREGASLVLADFQDLAAALAAIDAARAP
jgi:phosphoglycolate phosphatase-like HAD superfamily hydrolase